MILDFIWQSKMLHTLYIRGRHHMIATIAASRTFNALHPIIRCYAKELFAYKLTNIKDSDTFIHEVFSGFR